MITTLDVGFEDYVVFHRGIAEAGIQEDGHLHIIYQDGTDQDLGDPFGDEARAKAAEAQALIDQLQALIDANKVEDANTVLEALEDAIATANELMEMNTVNTEAFNNEVQAIAENVATETVECIEGIASKEVEEGGETKTVYYVDIETATDADIDAIFGQEGDDSNG